MDFQNTRFQLAEMKTKAEVLRSFINDCVDRVKQGSLDAATASMAKYWGSQTQNEIMDGCLQLHGGYGFIMVPYRSHVRRCPCAVDLWRD